jgi:hypothetical protein
MTDNSLSLRGAKRRSNLACSGILRLVRTT